MTTAVGYVRVSSDEQAEEGYSLAAQERAIRLYCELHNLTLVTVYVDDGYSGRTANRPAFERLLRDARANAFQHIVVHKFDRWARNVVLLLETIQDLANRKVAFVSISEQFDCSTPMGKMMLTIIASIAQFYSDNLGVEVTKGILEKVRQGYWHGPFPIGYRKGVQGILEPSEDAPVVVLAFELYATGQYSYLDVARELNRRGYRLYNVQKGTRVLFDKWNLEVILKNSVYRGFVKFKDQRFPGLHEPLIDQDTWNKVQAIVERHAAKHGRVSLRSDATGGGVLTELVYCEHCDSRMHYHPSTSKSGHSYGYYRCAGHEKLICTAGGVRSDKVEAQMRTILQALALPEELRVEVVRHAERLSGGSVAPSAERIALDQQLNVLENARQCGLLVGELYEQKRAELQAKRDTLLEEAPRGPSRAELIAAAQLLADLPALMAATPIAEQRAILRSIFDKVWVTAHTVCAIMPNSLYLPLASATERVCGEDGPGGRPATLVHWFFQRCVSLPMCQFAPLYCRFHLGLRSIADVQPQQMPYTPRSA